MQFVLMFVPETGLYKFERKIL